MSEKTLEQRIVQLEIQLARRTDREQIENLMAVYEHYMTGNQGPRVLSELWAIDRPDASIEIGPSGVYVGRRNIRKLYEKDVLPGKLYIHTLSTPDIEIAADGKSARGLWFSIGAESFSGDLGSAPPKTLEERELMTSVTPDGKQYMAEWVWGKVDVEFIRDNEGWKILHYHYYELFRCPYQMDWVQFSALRQYADGLRLEAMFASNLPFGPDEPPENNADFESTYHWQYRTDAVAEPVPLPPSAKRGEI